MGISSFIVSSGIAGGLAGMVSSTADVLKTRMQVNGQSLLLVVKDMWRIQGPKMIFTGMASRVLWIIPSVTVSMTVYETLKG